MGFDYAQAAGAGTDTIDSQVLGPPFITIIQKGSPEFDETHKKYAEKKIDGCKPGQILFEPKRLILPQPLSVIPLAQTALYTEWKPNKGGFVGNRDVTVTSERGYRKGAPGSKDQYREYLGENELVYTITFMILFRQQEGWHKGMIAFTSTQLKHARNWSKAILNLKFPEAFKVPADATPPIFASKYDLSTFADSNTAGGWFAWKIVPAGILDPERDQQLLSEAFEAHKEARTALPRASQAALTSAASEVVEDDKPY